MDMPVYSAAHIEKLSQFDGVSTEDMPSGYLCVRRGHHYGIFSLESGKLVLPVEYARPRAWGNDLFLISTVSGQCPSQSGLFSCTRGAFILSMDEECTLTLSLDQKHVFAERRSRHPRVGGVFSLEENEWLLPLERGYMFGKVADCYSEKKHAFNGEEFVLVHDTNSTTSALGLFSPTRGMIFETRYERVHVMVIDGTLVAVAECDGKKECFVMCGNTSWKTPPAADIRVHPNDATPPLFIMKASDDTHPILGGWCLFDAEQNEYRLSGCDRIFRWRDNYVGVSARSGSMFYNVSAGEVRYVSGLIRLDTPIDDDRWIIKLGDCYGAYALSLDTVIIPPVFELLAHIHGDFFFAKWRGKSHIIDMKKGKMRLDLSIGGSQKVTSRIS